MRALNIGCGKNPIRQEGWTNLDVSGDADVFADLNGPLPFDDDTFDVMLASHVLEHLPNILPVMEELWRVAKPGCKFHAWVPYVGADVAFEDPTHCRFFAPISFIYFGQPTYWRSDYGYRGDWKPIGGQFVVEEDTYLKVGEQYIVENWQHVRNLVPEIRMTLEAVKPARPQGVPPIDPIEMSILVARFTSNPEELTDVGVTLGESV